MPVRPNPELGAFGCNDELNHVTASRRIPGVKDMYQGGTCPRPDWELMGRNDRTSSGASRANDRGKMGCSCSTPGYPMLLEIWL